MRRFWLLILPALVLILAVRTYRGTSGQEFTSEVTLARVDKDSPMFGLMALTGRSAEEEESERLALLAAATDAERLRILRDQEARRQRDSERLLEFAEQVSPDPVAIDALVRAIEYSPSAAVRADAAGRLIRDYLTDARMAGAPQRLLECGEEEAVEVLEALSREHPDHSVRGAATYAVAAVLKARAERTWDDPGSASALAERAEGLLEEVLADFSEVRSGRDMLADLARADLDELTRLRPGRLAPEIEGTDLEGRPMRLSDYRGRVVVLSFWGYWCSLCRAMLPHERSLVEEMEGRPFVFLGVNSDDPATGRAMKEQDQVNWRSWTDGGEVYGGQIAWAWNVRALPTFFLIDAEGVVRHKVGPRYDDHGVVYYLDEAGALTHRWQARAEEVREVAEALVREAEEVQGESGEPDGRS